MDLHGINDRASLSVRQCVDHLSPADNDSTEDDAGVLVRFETPSELAALLEERELGTPHGVRVARGQFKRGYGLAHR